ncbi:MAG: tRNA (N(6)-L-threonylcarbamoyladenosine(37)-C(2))-methylthiotransferase MtaB [Eubacteriales bacterium]|nr:tRNA (N(6)-L-threonylcarbamoyladenosine(37)-C(2))-methylthiotransferase MtaB [Eubacteriales bacterium]
MRTVAIHNLGCKVNSYEAESMEQLLTKAGFTMVPFDENAAADIYIINTCSVTNIADRKSRQMLHKAKKMNPNAIVIAAGCYAQADSENAKADESVDMIVGNNMKINIVEAIAEYDKNHLNNILLEDLSVKQPYEELEIDQVNEHTRAYIKIQDGCNQFCSYCIIPYTRGRIRSREMSDIIAEVERLAEKGYKEVVLTGIHLSSYGVDNNKGSLIEVIECIEKIDGIERIRLGSLEPRIVTDEFVKRLGNLKKLCPHFHLSLQSGCDKTLKAMNRRYTTDEYEMACNRLRENLDNPAITTDVIVGFPQETDEDFCTTKEYLEKIHFYEMHIFKFSRRKGTVADKMSGQIDEKTKAERSSILLELEKKMSRQYREWYVGRKLEILVEDITECDGKKFYSGYSKNYIRILIPKEQLDALSDTVINNIFSCTCKKLYEGKMMIAKAD